MAKKALLGVLEQTIGKYVKNLDAESLNVAVWSGKIELHSLELDTQAVNLELDRKAAEAPNLAIPFKVVSGSFESLEVDVPWAHLTSRPVTMKARGLKVFVEPYDRLSEADHLQAIVDNESKRAEKVAKARKESIGASDSYRLQANAVRNLARADLEGQKGSSQESSSSFASRLVRRIIENVQINLEDIHICLNDSDGAAGVVLESLALVTTDKDGKNVFVDRTAASSDLENSFLYKALSIEGLGLYLDHAESIKNTLGAIVEDGESDGDFQHSYVLAPLSFKARLRQADGNVCIDNAKYRLSSELSSLSILLSQNQLDLARKISKVVAPSDGMLCPLFPEYRPLARVTKETAVDWWKYAARCIGRLNGRRSWVEFFIAFKKRKRYIPLYRRKAHHATCPWIQPLTKSEENELAAIEQDRSIAVEGIMAWRNVADAQVDKELEKHKAQQSKEQRGLFSSIFGSSKATTDTVENNAPIQLNVEELKELETMSLEDFSDANLSSDSKLCDIRFLLSSLRINLTSYDLRHIAALELGAVSVDFDANADGAFGFEFKLSSLGIKDMVTPKSMFPNVLQSVPTVHNENQVSDGVFRVQLEKSTSGDQKLLVKLAAFEAVASPILFREVKQFFAVAPVMPTSGKSKYSNNPILAQSLSGSVDLFYDADQGTQQLTVSPGLLPDSGGASTSLVSSELSNALIDAWKSKTETKASWVMDIDIKAPLVLIPEKCTDPRANVLVFDLGHLQLHYGKIDPAQKVVAWFEDQQYQSHDAMLDSGRLSVNDLTFVIGKADSVRQLIDDKASESVSENRSAVVEPISLSLDFGVESTNGTDVPRVCCFGVIPSVSLKVSPSLAAQGLIVLDSWKTVLAETGKHIDAAFEGPALAENPSEVESFRTANSRNSRQSDQPDIARDSDSAVVDKVDARTLFHFEMGLQRLSLALVSDSSDCLEANLVSVYVASSSMSDGRSINRLRMGWFWILDRVKGDYNRRQRLVAHSKLPQSPAAFAEQDEYDILGDLTRRGAFDNEPHGSSELADITLQTGSCLSHPDFCDTSIDTILDAKFSSLSIHWNPHAIKGIQGMVEKLTSLGDNVVIAGNSNALIVSPGPPSTPKNTTTRAQQRDKPSRMLVIAEMESLQINLNSARDDFPLYVCTMARARVSLLTSQEISKEMQASLVLGDVSVKTPDMGRTKPAYRTLIGLAPGRSESLLAVKYCVGQKAITSLGIDSLDTSNLEACAEVDLSPMRMVYIQSQVLTLVDYISEGILGALAARAATSAAEAAKEIANSVSGEKFFLVKANAFDVLLPQAAHSDSSMSIQAGRLSVEYRMFSDPGGGEANVSLSDVSLKDSKGTIMQENPIRMDVLVKLPPEGIGSLDEQAMRVNIDISKAAFALSQPNYAQILRTLDGNIGETELYLRDKPSQVAVKTKDEDESGTSMPDDTILTHAGVAEVQKMRRLYLEVRISVLSLALCGVDQSNPIVCIAAVNADIALHQFPDQESRHCKLVLGNLVCEDRRMKAASRQYRYLIHQGTSDGRNEASTDLFYIEYNADKTGSKIDLRVGTPQIVFIPDAIADVLGFLRVEDMSRSSAPTPDHNEEVLEVTSRQIVTRVETTQDGDDVEATLSSKVESLRSILTVSIDTNRCRFILVDLGSQSAAVTSTNVQRSNATTQVAETIVIQGVFAASMSIASDVESKAILSADAQGQGDAMEVFTAFGSDLRSPLQILDPSEFSAHGSLKTAETGDMLIEVRAAALTPFEVVFSMHNAALLNAILLSVNESFVTGNGEEIIELQSPLDEEEKERIEQLASALEDTGSNDSFLRRDASRADEFSVESKGNAMNGSSPVTFQCKLTMPETRITVVNDLQGLDDALFRMTVENFVAGGELRMGEKIRDRVEPLFDFHLNTMILADYFDSSMNLWRALLTKPWEMTLKGRRTPNSRFKTSRLSTTVDLETCACSLSFSEQFLGSLAGANRMWSMYSMATALPPDQGTSTKTNAYDAQLRQSMAASAARNLVTSLPYAIENHCGLDSTFLLPGVREDLRSCSNGTTQYFRFEPPQGKGHGGRRLYGQDVSYSKSVIVFLGDSKLVIDHLDSELGGPKRAHELDGGLLVFTHIVKTGKTIILHLSSHIEVHNHTCIPFDISVLKDGKTHNVGLCGSKASASQILAVSPIFSAGSFSKPSRCFSIPVDMLRSFSQQWTSGKRPDISLALCPKLISDDGTALHPHELQGTMDLGPVLDALRRDNQQAKVRFETTCRTEMGSRNGVDPFVVQVSVWLSLVSEAHVSLDIILEPRAVIENRMPVGISVRTPMPHTFCSRKAMVRSGKESTYDLPPYSQVEVFTPGPSIAVTAKTTDIPIGGTTLGWMEGGWIDLPLVQEFRLPEPLVCTFPFACNQNPDVLARTGATGSEFFIAENVEGLAELTNLRRSEGKHPAASSASSSAAGFETKLDSLAPRPSRDDLRAFYVTVCCYAVDHTGNILFEQVVDASATLRRSLSGETSAPTRRKATDLVSRPFSAFASRSHGCRITLLPSGHIPLRILQLTMEGDYGLKKSLPFLVENIAMGAGGLDSTPICWETKEASGYFAYRKLLNEHQSELHIIPEFILFNGSSDLVLVKERGKDEVIIEPGKVAPLAVSSRSDGLQLSFNFVELGCTSPYLPVDNLGMKVTVLNSNSGFPMGSVCVQTVVDTQGDSRLVVKLGKIQTGAIPHNLPAKTSSIFQNDCLRLRVRWSELQVTLKESKSTKDATASRALRSNSSKEFNSPSRFGDGDGADFAWLEHAVTTIVFSRFTVDYQRLFKEESDAMSKTGSALLSPERAQLSVIVHNLKIRDDMPETTSPIIFDSTPDINFLDLCIRLRGPSDADLVKVDLFDLSLAHQQNGSAGKLFLNTSEDFVWNIIDLANRIMAASEELAGSTLKLEENKDDGGYTVSMVDSNSLNRHEVAYTPPKSDKLYDIKVARVSPITFVVSFRRNPQASRYQHIQNGHAASVMNYFSKRLKFTIDKAELKYARYENKSLKGPPEQLIESLCVVYLARTKSKLLTLITAASFQDWKFLAARDQGDDEFVEGDILRATGNLAGKTAGQIFQGVGKGLGYGVSGLSRTIGDGIEKSSEKIGASKLGAGVNSVVSGVGDGVGDTIVGVGTGAGKMLKGAGLGLGKVVGGVAGGAMLVGKGIGKGIVTGDGNAIVSGFAQGASSIGDGVGQGFESAVMGAADGVLSAGQGLFSGVKRVGRGVGGAFKGKKPDQRKKS